MEKIPEKHIAIEKQKNKFILSNTITVLWSIWNRIFSTTQRGTNKIMITMKYAVDDKIMK